MRDRLGFIVEPACATSLAGLLERYKRNVRVKKLDNCMWFKHFIRQI